MMECEISIVKFRKISLRQNHTNIRQTGGRVKYNLDIASC